MAQLVRCNAVLHPNDLPEGYKLLRDGQPLPLENDPHVIRRGIHAQVRCSAIVACVARRCLVHVLTEERVS